MGCRAPVRCSAVQAPRPAGTADNVTVSAGTGSPSISLLAHPQSQTITAGSDVSFVVVANGSPPLTYQWRKDGTPLGGQDRSPLLLPAVPLNGAGIYDVVVTSGATSVTSNPATLTVNPAVVAPANDLFANRTVLSGSARDDVGFQRRRDQGNGRAEPCGQRRRRLRLVDVDRPGGRQRHDRHDWQRVGHETETAPTCSFRR